MKGITVLSLPLLVSGAVIQNELHRQQTPNLDLSALGLAETKLEKPVTVKKLTASMKLGAVKEQVLWGPFKLQPANGTHAGALKLDPHSDIISSRVAGVCKECMVLSAKADLADKNGNKMESYTGVSSQFIIMTSLNGQRMASPAVAPNCPNGKMVMADSAQAPAVQTTAGQTTVPKASPNPETKAPPPGAPVNTAAPPSSTAKTNKDGGIFDVAGSGPVAASTPPAPTGLVIPGTGISIPGLPTMDALGPILGATAGSALGAILGTLLGAPLGALLGVAASTDFGKQVLGGGTPGLSPGSLGAGLAALAPSYAVLIGQGDEGTGLKFVAETEQFKSGFYLGKETELNLMAEIANYNAQERDVYVKVEYEYLPNMPTRPQEYYDVGMGAINVAPCESLNSMPPRNGPVKYVSPAWTVHSDGYLLDIKPHLNNGGLNMTLYVNGQESCSSEAIYGGTDGGLAANGEKWETITGYTECPEPVKIRVGDSLTMDAHYDLTKHRLQSKSDNSGEAEGIARANFIFAQPSK